jgi:hypothetical protein
MFLLLVCGYSSLGNLLMLPLTERFPAWSAGRTPDGIIVLGGSIDPERSQARGSLEIDASPSASLRCCNWHGAIRKRASCSAAAVQI